MSFAVYMGLYYGHAKVSEAVHNPDAKALNLKASYAFAVLLHTIFDATLMVESDIGLIFFFIFRCNPRYRRIPHDSLRVQE